LSGSIASKRWHRSFAGLLFAALACISGLCFSVSGVAFQIQTSKGLGSLAFLPSQLQELRQLRLSPFSFSWWRLGLSLHRLLFVSAFRFLLLWWCM
jgi:hypothetical protein